MKKKRKPLNIIFENPNTPEETVRLLAKVFAPKIALREFERIKKEVDNTENEKAI